MQEVKIVARPKLAEELERVFADYAYFPNETVKTEDHSAYDFTFPLPCFVDDGMEEVLRLLVDAKDKPVETHGFAWLMTDGVHGESTYHPKEQKLKEMYSMKASCAIMENYE